MLRLALIAALLSGCSIALQSKPRDGVRCSTSSAYWIADTALAVAGAVGFSLAVLEIANYSSAGPFAVGSVVYFASADNGRERRRLCRSREMASSL